MSRVNTQLDAQAKELADIATGQKRQKVAQGLLRGPLKNIPESTAASLAQSYLSGELSVKEVVTIARNQSNDAYDRQQDAIKQKADVESEKKAEQMADAKAETLIAGKKNVITNLNDAIDIAKNDGLIPATGAVGAVLKYFPAIDAMVLSKKVESIKANIGFDRLQQMRDFSKTGGALGQVAVQELNALQNSIDALDPDMGEKRFLEAVERIKGHYINSVNLMQRINGGEKELTEEDLDLKSRQDDEWKIEPA